MHGTLLSRHRAYTGHDALGCPSHHFTNTLSRYMWGTPFELLGGHLHVAWGISVKLLEYPYAARCLVAANLMIFTLSWTS